MGTLGERSGFRRPYRGSFVRFTDYPPPPIFTTSLPPAVMAMALAAIELVQSEPQRRDALRHNCQKLKQGLSRLGFELGRSESPILPLIVGDAARCMALSADSSRHPCRLWHRSRLRRNWAGALV
jgi:7-keto-8-aminopelargonate synthetase-like enzyme